MAIEVVSASMITSDSSQHIARCVGGDRWVVSWLPGRTLTGTQAVAAMALAGALSDGAPNWADLDAMALQLGLTAREAVYLVAIEQHDISRPRRRRRDSLS
ncbi:hypothetical protein [Nocardia nova]|uniref:Uncharacterized protein n=1 Tax=Nocardia nova SH22a TaxID=1415166 RepID=W5TM42_9NOCA|nr:hypothetical protein [Nocardia nova]AHH20390.1 hypothetical protein NONO_c56100 [Nocardia nova SH22a]